MTSLLTCLTRLGIKAYTYKYRKNHISLSKNVKLKNSRYNPKNFSLEVLKTDLSDSIMLKSALEKHANNVTLSIYDGLFHDFQYFAPFLRESKVAWREMVNFIRQ